MLLESMSFPEPVIAVSIEPKTKADQEKLALTLGKLQQEDPTFKVHTEPDTGQTLISGMGELHLEIITDRSGPGIQRRRQHRHSAGGLQGVADARGSG